MRKTVLFGAFLLFLSSLTACNQPPSSSPLPAHHNPDGSFKNLYEPSAEETALSDSTRALMGPLSWIFGREGRPKSKLFPIVRGNEELWEEGAAASISWIGHSTFYIRWNNLGILTDPHFSERASPVSWAGPKRGTPPGRAIDSLPGVDLVLISHDHYDHLDLPSIKQLLKHYPDARYLVPLQLAKILRKQGVRDVVELDWWGELDWKGLRLLCVPAHHWSKRSLFNRNTTLWSGWLIEHQGKKIWFSGDTGFGDGSIFKELYRREGPLDLALITIGAYLPRDFMLQQHLDPEQGVRVHQMVGAQKSIAHHWGNFILSFEEVDAPPIDLRIALDSAEIDSSAFIAMRHGEIAPLGW